MSLAWRLEHYAFTHQEVRAKQEHDPDGPAETGDTRIELAIALEENPVGFSIILSLQSSEQVNARYAFKLEVVGRFSTNRALTEEDHPVAQQEAGRILVGVARERLMDLTSRGPWPPFLLGLVPLAAGESTPRKRAPRRRAPAPAP